MAQTTRPPVPIVHADEVLHRRLLAERANDALSKSGTDGMTAPLPLSSYTIATLPTASLWTGSMIYVSDETGGAIPCFSDGTDWRRTSDRAVAA